MFKTVVFYSNDEFQKSITKEEYKENFIFTERVKFSEIDRIFEMGNDLRIETMNGDEIWYSKVFGTWKKIGT